MSSTGTRQIVQLFQHVGSRCIHGLEELANANIDFSESRTLLRNLKSNGYLESQEFLDSIAKYVNVNEKGRKFGSKGRLCSMEERAYEYFVSPEFLYSIAKYVNNWPFYRKGGYFESEEFFVSMELYAQKKGYFESEEFFASMELYAHKKGDRHKNYAAQDFSSSSGLTSGTFSGSMKLQGSGEHSNQVPGWHAPDRNDTTRPSFSLIQDAPMDSKPMGTDANTQISDGMSSELNNNQFRRSDLTVSNVNPEGYLNPGEKACEVCETIMLERNLPRHKRESCPPGRKQKKKETTV